MNQWGLEKSHWRKHWQWFEIHRNLAQVVADDDIVRPPPSAPLPPGADVLGTCCCCCCRLSLALRPCLARKLHLAASCSFMAPRPDR